MPPKQYRFQRPLGDRRYRKLFIIAVEGSKTEPRYFDMVNSREAVIHVACLKGGAGGITTAGPKENEGAPQIERAKSYRRSLAGGEQGAVDG